MTTPMEDLLNTLEATKNHINKVPCFLCLQDSEQPLIIITEDILEGAPEDGSRAIIVSICSTCYNEEYHHLADKAKELMAKSGLALPNQLFKADVRLQ